MTEEDGTMQIEILWCFIGKPNKCHPFKNLVRTIETNEPSSVNNKKNKGATD